MNKVTFMKMKCTLLLVVTIMGLLFTSGCALFVVGGAAATGAGTVAWIHGELHSTEAATLDKAWNATLAAMKDLEFAVTAKEKDAITGKLTARGAGDKKIQITVNKASGTTAEIRIRVGTFGDSGLSHTILDKIRTHL